MRSAHGQCSVVASGAASWRAAIALTTNSRSMSRSSAAAKRRAAIAGSGKKSAYQLIARAAAIVSRSSASNDGSSRRIASPRASRSTLRLEHRELAAALVRPDAVGELERAVLVAEQDEREREHRARQVALAVVELGVLVQPQRALAQTAAPPRARCGSADSALRRRGRGPARSLPPSAPARAFARPCARPAAGRP